METEKYYYIRDKEKRPVVTVCLIKSNGDVARGVAICSLQDHPKKSTGRAIARGRAVKALHHKVSCEPILRALALQTLYAREYSPDTLFLSHWKSAYMYAGAVYGSGTNDFEKKLLGIEGG